MTDDDVIVTTTPGSDAEDTRAKPGDGETSREQEMTEDAAAEEARDEETADKDVQGRTAARVGAVT